MQGSETNSNLLENFLDELSVYITQKGTGKDGVVGFANNLQLVGRRFTFEGYEYQRDILTDNHPNQCLKKGSQMGITEDEIIRHIYNLMTGVYPVGAMVIMPTGDAVSRYVKMRFNPLIEENFSIKSSVSSTDSVDIKKVNKGFLNFVGARATHKVDEVRKSAIAAKSTPADALLFDEYDEMDIDMVRMFEKRLGNSDVAHMTKLSTPTVTGFGIELDYEESDQHVWMIKCEKCGRETCLEIEFPNCLKETINGEVFRCCIKCGGQIFPRNGRWVAQYPNRTEKRGRWISRLNARKADLKSILHDFQNKVNLQELYNSELALGYVPKESELTAAEVFARCGQDPMQNRHDGPCAMGVDVMKELYVVVGFKPEDKRREVCYLARVSSFNDVADIAKRFNVRCAVIEKEPETRAVLKFAKSQSYPVYASDYKTSVDEPEWDFHEKTLDIHRTITMDMTHDTVTSDLLTIPRRCSEIELFAKQLASPVKYLKEDKERNVRTYHYRPRGADHYYHALGFFLLACEKVKKYEEKTAEKKLLEYLRKTKEENQSPLYLGINNQKETPLNFGLNN